MNEAWIGRCKECNFEGRIKPIAENIDEDCKIYVFYCPKCGAYVSLI